MNGVNKIISEEDFLDALDGVTWYNCLAEEIIKWKDPENYETSSPAVLIPMGGFLLK